MSTKPHNRFFLFDYAIPVFILLSLGVQGVFWTLDVGGWGRFVLLPAIILGVLPLAKDIITSLLRKHFGVDVIAIIAIIASTVLGEYTAAAVVLLMLSGGEALETFAIKRARKELTTLLNNAPRIAHRMTDGVITDIHVDKVLVGDTILVKPGEMIPVDGTVLEGESEVNESALTGESIPLEKIPHAQVFSGSVNGSAVLTITATKLSSESKYSQIIRLVQEAERSKAPFVRLADRYSVWFTVLALSLAGAAWLLSGELIRAVAVLVVATPCPLILATPIAFASGVSKAAKRGVIIKHGGSIEKLAEAKCFLFDKTGTLTFGTPKLTRVISYHNQQEQELIHIASSLDQFSNHVLARAFTSHAKAKGASKLDIPEEFTEKLGYGVSGRIKGSVYTLGRLTYLQSLGVTIPPEVVDTHTSSKNEGAIQVYLANQTTLLGTFVFEDTIRSHAKSLFTNLKSQHVHVVMLTGDKKQTALHIAKQAGIDTVYAQCLPEEKVRIVKKERETHQPVVMVGDGVNDAPALAVADVGIAMGAHGSSAASESGDVVVMVDTVERVGEILQLSKRVLRIAKESIGIGIGLSIGLMIIASLGYITPVHGALMQEAIDVLVILNALRVQLATPT